MGLELRQTQKMKLNMTQSLYQAISLLQYNTQELYDYLYQQSLENPLIQLEESGQEARQMQKAGTHSMKTKSDVIEEVTSSHTDFRDELIEQARFLDENDQIKSVIFYLIESLDERGYLTFPIEEVIEELNLSYEIAYRSLDILQDFEPKGIGARNLQECLLLQLEARDPRHLLAETIVRDYLALIAEGREELAQLLNVTVQEVEAALSTIQNCEPHPASIPIEPVQYIVPDATVFKQQGKYTVLIEDQWLPRLSVNEQYYLALKTGEASQYASQKYKEAQWLQSSLMQRRETLLKVTKTIVDLQQPFLDQGLAFLKPMTLKDVAEQIDIHESTVSRTIKNKFLQTTYGVLPYKRLFATGLPKPSGELVSTERIKARLADIIEHENKCKPYSDQSIVQILKKEENILVSRRAIAKYRTSCGYPSSSKRKVK